jgi:hypothetical protein
MPPASMLSAAIPPSATNNVFQRAVAPAPQGNLVFKQKAARVDVCFSLKIAVSLRRTLVSSVSLPHSTKRPALH